MCFSTELEKMDVVAKAFNAQIDEKAFIWLKAQAAKYPDIYKWTDKDLRVFPDTWGYIMILDHGQRILRPYRYQLLPHFCKGPIYKRKDPKTGKEKKIPTYNARFDGLESRFAWKGIFGKQHGICFHRKFFEWVSDPENPKKSKLGYFTNEQGVLWAACLWDSWSDSEDSQLRIDSYAIVTTDPVDSILKAGHDRMPAFIKKDRFDEWLTPGQSGETYKTILQQRESEKFNFHWEY